MMYSGAAVSVSRGGRVTAGVGCGEVACACAVPAQAQKAIGATKTAAMANTVENRRFVAIWPILISIPSQLCTTEQRAGVRGGWHPVKSHLNCRTSTARAAWQFQ